MNNDSRNELKVKSVSQVVPGEDYENPNGFVLDKRNEMTPSEDAVVGDPYIDAKAQANQDVRAQLRNSYLDGRRHVLDEDTGKIYHETSADTEARKFNEEHQERRNILLFAFGMFALLFVVGLIIMAFKGEL